MAQIGYPSLFQRNVGGIGLTSLPVPDLLFSKKFNVTINKKQNFNLNIDQKNSLILKLGQSESFALKLDRNKSFSLKIDRN